MVALEDSELLNILEKMKTTLYKGIIKETDHSSSFRSQCSHTEEGASCWGTDGSCQHCSLFLHLSLTWGNRKAG